ncbi:glycoside hydrolase family 18 [uncultured Bacteroides sp.]|uniref:glycoside hydrolase family 18 n=1 Tax=uncultured Bacteroides sp. TaxID=162156 RepID=UPI001F8DE9CD|nr:glycoside hydrolase family 18 [uncultured Bacteroides sp.]MBU3808724.1 hypothetical protein [Candidatus Phocaeicola faecipullorum]
MKSISKIIIGAAIAGGTVFSACSDWTESEAFKVNETNIEDQNPELYAEYLANLREYRNTDHKLVYAWFDNSVKQSYSRANHLTDIPDSIDVVSLMYPDKLVKSEAAEIEQIRGEKGMKVIFNIDFEAIKSTYDAMVEDATEEEPVTIDFHQYLTDTLSYSLSLVKKYNYDGICIDYQGQVSIYMTEEEKKEYKENENNFINVINDWKERNPEKLLAFHGRPENLVDGSFILDKCSAIFISSEEAVSVNELSYIFNESCLDSYAAKYGALADVENDGLTLQSFAEWAAMQHSGNDLVAVGVYNLSTDYHASGRNYENVREMISILNPSVK